LLSLRPNPSRPVNRCLLCKIYWRIYLYMEIAIYSHMLVVQCLFLYGESKSGVGFHLHFQVSKHKKLIHSMTCTNKYIHTYIHTYLCLSIYLCLYVYIYIDMEYQPKETTMDCPTQSKIFLVTCNFSFRETSFVVVVHFIG